MIDGVEVRPLKIFCDERGQVMRMLRSDDPLFKGFGEVYFSVTNPGVVKGWKKHLKMTQHFAVPRGNIKLVLYDGRKVSATCGKVQEVLMGEDNYQLVRIPADIWYGFACVGQSPAMIANCSDIPHDPAESVQVALEDKTVPYTWDPKGL